MKTALNLRSNHHHNIFINIKVAALIIVTLLTLAHKGNTTDVTNATTSNHLFYLAQSK